MMKGNPASQCTPSISLKAGELHALVDSSHGGITSAAYFLRAANAHIAREPAQIDHLRRMGRAPGPLSDFRDGNDEASHRGGIRILHQDAQRHHAGERLDRFLESQARP